MGNNGILKGICCSSWDFITRIMTSGDFIVIALEFMVISWDINGMYPVTL